MTHAKLPGTYVLVMTLAEGRRLAVGRLGEIDFAPGCYLYVGSALGGLEHRLRRHLRLGKRLHWHIDYLRPAVEVTAIWYRPGAERRECAWAAALAGLPGVRLHAPGFGASDCRCPGHLFYAVQPPALADFAARAGPAAPAPPDDGETPWLCWERNLVRGAGLTAGTD